MADCSLGGSYLSYYPLGIVAMVDWMNDSWTLVRIGIWWFPFNWIWTALLMQGLQVRTEHLSPPNEKGGYCAILTASGALLSLLSQVVSGPLSDRCNHPFGRRRPFIAVGVLFALPVMFGFVWAKSFVFLVVCFAMLQWWLNFASAPTRALLPDLISPSRHGIASAQVGIWSLVGQVIGIVSTGILLSFKFWRSVGLNLTKRQAESIGLQWTIGTAAVVLSLITAFVLTLPDKPTSNQPKSKDGAPLIQTLQNAYKIEWHKHEEFLWLLLSRFTINLGFYTAVVFLRWFLKETLQVKDPAQATMQIGLLVTVVTVPSVWLGGKLSDKISKRNLCIVTALVSGIGAFWFALTPNFMWTYLPAVILGIGSGIFGVANWALAVNLMPKDEGGKFFAVWQFAFTLPQVIGPALTGKIGDVVNQAYGGGLGWRIIFICCVVIMLIGIAFLFKVKEKKSI